MKPSVFVILFTIGVFGTEGAMAQGSNRRIGVHIGFNSYDMADFKTLENGFVSDVQSLVPMKAIERFPSRISAGFSYSYPFRGTDNTFQYGFHSSGSRYHYGDYSGEIGLNSVMTAHSMSGQTAFRTYTSNDNTIHVYAGLGSNIYFGTYQANDFVHVGTLRQSNESEFNFSAFSIEPFFRVQKRISRFSLNLKAGFDMALQSEVTYEGKKISFDGSRAAKAEMSGFRTELSLQFHLK